MLILLIFYYTAGIILFYIAILRYELRDYKNFHKVNWPMTTHNSGITHIKLLMYVTSTPIMALIWPYWMYRLGRMYYQEFFEASQKNDDEA